MSTPVPDLQFQSLVCERYAGNPQAITALGARLIVGRDSPCSPADGAALLTEAAKQGDSGAWSYLALLAAVGIARDQSWGDALMALRHAAELHDGSAVRQMELLAGAGIRNASDIGEWLTPGTARILHETPCFAAFAGLLAPALCEHLITRSTSRLIPAQVYDARIGGLKTDAMRTNTGAAYSVIDTDMIMQLARARIARAAGVAFNTLEPTEVLHYSVGERYKLHIDFFHPSVPRYTEEMKLKGQRIKTALVYLNSGYEGGETEFPKIGLKFRGEPGEALIFENMAADGTGDMNTLHTGLPPTQGEKWLLSQWIREKPQPVV